MPPGNGYLSTITNCPLHSNGCLVDKLSTGADGNETSPACHVIKDALPIDHRQPSLLIRAMVCQMLWSNCQTFTISLISQIQTRMLCVWFTNSCPMSLVRLCLHVSRQSWLIWASYLFLSWLVLYTFSRLDDIYKWANFVETSASKWKLNSVEVAQCTLRLCSHPMY